MPKGKGNRKASGAAVSRPQDTESANSAKLQAVQCLTLDEDEVTRCGRPATAGYPQVERCKPHHAQYQKMYIKYKAASKIVENTKREKALPTKDQIDRSTDVHSLLKKARWVRKYLEAIRVEKSGREIHSRRFFLKVDAGHKQRMKILEKQMAEAVEILNALESRAFHLRVADNPAHKWISDFQNTGLFRQGGEDMLSTKNIIGAAQPPSRHDDATTPSQPKRPLIGHAAVDATNSSGTPDLDQEESEDLDLIDLELRSVKARLLVAFELFENAEVLRAGYGRAHPESKHNDGNTVLPDQEISKLQHTFLQYARRSVFYEPVLFLKALDKVSFKDLFLDEDFSIEDAARLRIMFEQRLGLGLLWWKDSIQEAITIASHVGTAANVGDPKDRLKILGGWIFNRAHTGTLSNEAWWVTLQTLEPPANVENRFVRLCNNFDDILGFLSFGALGFIPPPSFCLNQDQSLDCEFYRKHLTLCGVVVADMVSSRIPPFPIPTRIPAKRLGCMVWAQIESRSYMFGAIRNEPDDFNDAFLRELRARPDVFQVVTRSDTDPDRHVEAFGGPIPGEALPQTRTRQFEAPITSLANPPDGRGEQWSVERSAVDVLYGKKMIDGYLTTLDGPKKRGWFFRFKKMPVKFFVIIDAVPGRHVSNLAREVAWAALRAKGLATGVYSRLKYARASDVLFQKSANERFAWTGGGVNIAKMEDQL